MTRTRIGLALVLALVLVLGACGDDDGATTEATTTTTEAAVTTAAATTAAATTTTTPATTTAAPTTTTTEPPPAEPDLPETPVVGVIDTPYKWGDETGAATQDELPFPIGGIEAHWYTAGDWYAVAYIGLDLEATGPLCPGSSILTARGFEFVSNSPSPGGTCEGSMAQILGPPAGTQVCGGTVSYVTAIPAGTEGALYASIEIYDRGSTFYGASGTVDADPASMPVIDPLTLDC